MGKMTLGLDPHPATRPQHVEGAAGSYEFTQLQEHTIASLAKAMRFVGIFMIIAGIVSGVGAVIAIVGGRFVTSIASAVGAVIDIVLGTYLRSSAASFQSVVDTRGSDIPNLMWALEQLRRFFNLQRILIIIGIVLTVLTIVYLLL